MELINACGNNDIEKVIKLINEGIDVHARDDYAFRWSANNGHLDIVKFLLDRGANIHAQDDYALGWSAEKRHLVVVKFLLIRKANKEKIKSKSLHRYLEKIKKLCACLLSLRDTYKLFDRNVLGIVFWF
jgi:hypothetical protein